jgi:hypothetical protein
MAQFINPTIDELLFTADTTLMGVLYPSGSGLKLDVTNVSLQLFQEIFSNYTSDIKSINFLMTDALVIDAAVVDEISYRIALYNYTWDLFYFNGQLMYLMRNSAYTVNDLNIVPLPTTRAIQNLVPVWVGGNIVWESYQPYTPETMPSLSQYGAVKINGNSDGSKPSWTSQGNIGQTIAYTTPLTLSPTIQNWPYGHNGQDYLYDKITNRFLENPVDGQSHTWRVELTFSNPTSQNVSLSVKLINPLNGFINRASAVLPFGVADKIMLNLITIADLASIGTGYILIVECNVANVQLTLDSVTRISNSM